MKRPFPQFSVRTLLILTLIVAAAITLTARRLNDRNRDIQLLNRYVAQPDVQPLHWGGKSPPASDTQIEISGRTEAGGTFTATIRPESDLLWGVGRFFGINLTNSRIVALKIDAALDDSVASALARLPSLESLAICNSHFTDDGLLDFESIDKMLTKMLKRTLFLASSSQVCFSRFLS